jgi:hypothetical protein
MAWGPAKQGTAPKQSAIKAHQRETEYVRERDVYLRLLECDVARIRGCEVPQFIDCDDDRCVIEMTMVSPPFLLDFAGAYLDWTPDFSDEALADWRADKLEQFGARWHEVELILGALQSYGIYMIDVHPGNLAFGD